MSSDYAPKCAIRVFHDAHIYVTVPLVPLVDRIVHGLVRMDVIPSGLALGDPDYPVNWVIPPFIPFFRI